MAEEKPYQYSEKSPIVCKQCVCCGTIRVLEIEPAECPTCTKYDRFTTDVQDTIMLPVSHDIPQKTSYGITGRFLA